MRVTAVTGCQTSHVYPWGALPENKRGHFSPPPPGPLVPPLEYEIVFALDRGEAGPPAKDWMPETDQSGPIRGRKGSLDNWRGVSWPKLR